MLEPYPLKNMISLALGGAQAIGVFFFFFKSPPGDSNTELRTADQIQPLHFTNKKTKAHKYDLPINTQPKPQNRAMIL